MVRGKWENLKKFTIDDIKAAVYRTLSEMTDMTEEEIIGLWPDIYDVLADELYIDRYEFE